MSDTKKSLFCPHCNHPTPQNPVLRQEYLETLYATYSSDLALMEEADRHPGTYVVAICDVCSQVILYCSLFGEAPAETFSTEHLVWPRPNALARAVPERVRKIYAEAAAIRHSAPNAFAVMIRRALEALCEDRGVPDGTLAKRLEKLVSRGELPAALAEMSEVLRLLGNVGAHEGGIDVPPGHVPALEDFFRAIVEYVYVAPDQVRSFRKTIERLQAARKDKRDA